MNALIEREQAPEPRNAGEDASVWVTKLEECARLRSAYQDQQAAGFMTIDELGSKLTGLEKTRKLAQVELAALENREERVEELKKDRDALVLSWFKLLPEALENLTGEELNKLYRMLQLEVAPVNDGYSVTGVLKEFSYFETDISKPMLL